MNTTEAQAKIAELDAEYRSIRNTLFADGDTIEQRQAKRDRLNAINAERDELEEASKRPLPYIGHDSETDRFGGAIIYDEF